MKFTFYGQNCFSIQFGGKQLLIDPFITGNELAKDIDPESLEADYILLTHAHGDHVANAEQIARRTGAMIISNFEVVSHYQKKGLKGHPMNHGGKWAFEFGTVKYVAAVHTSTFPDGSPGGCPGGFVIWDEQHCIYIAGDTALTMDMKLIPMTCPKLDLAILPIGDNFTMGYEDAVIASDFIECDRIIGCHYDTFGYIRIKDKAAVKKAFADKGKELILLPIGTETEL